MAKSKEDPVRSIQVPQRSLGDLLPSHDNQLRAEYRAAVRSLKTAMIPYASTLAKMPEDSWTDIVLNKMPAEGDNSGYIQLTALMHGAYLILCLDHRRESRVDDSYTKLTHGTMVLTLQMGKIMSIQTGRDSGDDDSWTPGSRTYIQSQLPEWDAFKPALHRVDLLEEQIGTLQGFTSTLIEAGKPIANFDIVSE